jgi:16S rRNA (cytosine967-C5)-methyltransferase
MIAPARVAAYEALSAMSAGNTDLPTAIAFARDSLRDDRDRALAADIAAGVQRWRAALDHLIVQFSKRSLDRLDTAVVEILRMSAYQMLHLTRVPASAVVDDAVDLTRRAGKQSASGFVNAILREISRRRNKLPLPPRPSDLTNREAALDYLSITLSHPRWLAARWYDRLGFNAAEAWMRFDNTAAPVTLRVNRFKTTTRDLIDRLARADVRVRPARFAPDALIVEEGYPLRTTAFEEGAFVVQDEASQIVAWLASADPGARVLDTCASPGGKTTAIAAAMEGRGLLVACDVRPRRIELLQKTIAATAAPNVRVVQTDLTAALPFCRPFDTVLVDVPCSGLGTLRRDPDIRWRRREGDLRAFATAELTMLQHAADSVAAGGRLIYATCSSEPDENEAVVDTFLAADLAAGAFMPVDARAIAPAIPPALVDQRGHLRTSPDEQQLEPFFAAVFERRQL